ncbi:MAG TPA: SIS domain-containing protein [Chloroflexota bacterium]|nr:SIS domain-containing protein [Chloroflexota bacterium]
MSTSEATVSLPFAQRFIASYYDELHEAMRATLSPDLDRAVQILRHARARGGTIYFCGNGGSASTASHFACDLAKNTIDPTFGRFRTICLSDNVAAVSAWGNDNGYDQVFVEQARTFLREGDVLVAISGSGNSPNVLRAVEHARSLGCPVIGLIGFEGGALKAQSDVALVVPGRTIEQAEDGHLILNHALCTTIRALDALESADIPAR